MTNQELTNYEILIAQTRRREAQLTNIMVANEVTHATTGLINSVFTMEKFDKPQDAADIARAFRAIQFNIKELERQACEFHGVEYKP